MGRRHKCPYCNSVETMRKGHRKTKRLGLRSIRKCRACGRKFTPKHQDPRQAAEQPRPRGTRAPAEEQPDGRQQAAEPQRLMSEPQQPVQSQPPAPEPEPQVPSAEAAKPDGAPG